MNYRHAEAMIADLSATDIDLREVPMVELERTHREWDAYMAEGIARAIEEEAERRRDACRRHDMYREGAETW
jgi:hypothetical protein